MVRAVTWLGRFNVAAMLVGQEHYATLVHVYTEYNTIASRKQLTYRPNFNPQFTLKFIIKLFRFFFTFCSTFIDEITVINNKALYLQTSMNVFNLPASMVPAITWRDHSNVSVMLDGQGHCVT